MLIIQSKELASQMKQVNKGYYSRADFFTYPDQLPSDPAARTSVL